MNYVLKDHQGSLADLLNDKGQGEYFSFDVCSVKLGFWERSETKTLVEQIPSVKRIREGRRRNAQTWTYTNTPVSFGTTRGFTMHEHLDEFKLINMKSLPRKHDEGRVYDPLVGRFLSADPFIQQPDYSQSYNRYSYAFNNPLRFSDPSGFFAEGDSTLSPSRSLLHLPFLPAQRLSYRPGASTNTDNTSLGIVFKETETALPVPYLNSKLSRDAEGNTSEVASVEGDKPWYSIYNWPALGSSARTMDAIYTGDYLSSTGHFLTCAAEVFTLGYSSQITTGVRTAVGNLKVPVYRVYGEGATMYGKSYSLINPKYVPFYRNFAGLPNINSGQYLLKGSIPLRDINVGRWIAAPLNGNTGGLPIELYQNYNQLLNPANILIKKPF